MFVGYLDPALDADAFVADGWFRTGDLAAYDGEYLTIVDRLKDIIIRGGENISAAGGRDAARDAIPRVAEAACVAAPDPVMGEKVCAFVIAARASRRRSPRSRAHLAAAGPRPRSSCPNASRCATTLPRTAERQGAEGPAARRGRPPRRRGARVLMGETTDPGLAPSEPVRFGGAVGAARAAAAPTRPDVGARRRQRRSRGRPRATSQALADGGLAVPSWPREYGGLGATRRAARDRARRARPTSRCPTSTRTSSGSSSSARRCSRTAPRAVRALAARRSRTATRSGASCSPNPARAPISPGSRRARDARRRRVASSTARRCGRAAAHYARRGLLLARTDATVPKHAGITAFGLDLHAPGVDVRPLRQMNGDAHFTEVFLDERARPRRDRIGAVGDGWRVALTSLSYERGGVASPGGAWLDVDRLDRARARARRSRVDPARARQRLAQRDRRAPRRVAHRPPGARHAPGPAARARRAPG